jgi:glycosyltransferase involved in cell wall biosynthesis
LEENILKLLDDKKLAKKISLNNINKTKKYEWDIINKNYLNEYKSITKIN